MYTYLVCLFLTFYMKGLYFCVINILKGKPIIKIKSDSMITPDIISIL